MDTGKKVEHFIAEKESARQVSMGDKVFFPGTLPFVTITSQSGAGGHRFAEALLELIQSNSSGHDTLKGWRIFDKSMCQEVLNEEHLAESMTELLQEHYHSQITEFVMGIFGDSGMQNVAYARLSRLLRSVASVGKVIVLGHGGSMATGALAGGLHIRLVAPLATRAARMATVLDVDQAQAMQLIQQRDKGQRELVKTHYRIDSANPEHYDLVFNTERMSLDTAAELLLALLRKRLDS